MSSDFAFKSGDINIIMRLCVMVFELVALRLVFFLLTDACDIANAVVGSFGDAVVERPGISYFVGLHVWCQTQTSSDAV